MRVERGAKDEKSRICPSCRNAISVLATKCQYCGERVGRPKAELRTLSISDLGGESIHHRATSSSVLDAMESFRAEEQSASEDVKEDFEVSAVIGRRRKSEPDGVSMESSFEDLPTLDEGNQDILGMGLKKDSDSGTSASRKSGGATSTRTRLVSLVKVAGVLIALLFISVKGVGWVRDYMERQDEVLRPQFVNRAPAMIKNGARPLDILAAASNAVAHDENSENLKVLETSLDLLVEEVESYLNTRRWSLQELNKASSVATDALRIHPNETTIALDKEVKEENAAYKMVLISIDAENGTATFTLNRAGAPTVTVEKGETVGERFVLRNIIGRSKIRMSDTLRNDRSVTFPLGGLPE